MATGFEQEPRQFSRRHQLRALHAGWAAAQPEPRASNPINTRPAASKVVQRNQSMAVHAIEAVVSAARQGKINLPVDPASSVDGTPGAKKLVGQKQPGVQATPEDDAKLQAEVISMIRAQIPDPAAQNEAIALAMDRAGRIRSIAELEQLVSAIKAEAPARNSDSWDSSEGGHYRVDGTWVDDRGYSSSGYVGSEEFMGSSHNLFYGANGQLKSYQDGWNGWARTYGTGYFKGTESRSADVYDAAWNSKRLFKGNHPGDDLRQRAFTDVYAASKLKGAEFHKPDGTVDKLSMDEAHECVAKTSLEKLERLTSDKSEETAAGIAEDCRQAADRKRGIKPENDIQGRQTMIHGALDLDATFAQNSGPASPNQKPTTPSPAGLTR